MSNIYGLGTLPAPSGGAVALTILSNVTDLYALVLATSSEHIPDPIIQDDARKVFGGRLRYRVDSRIQGAPHAYKLMDLDSDALADGEVTYYHVYELHADGTYGPVLTAPCVPRCARDAVVTIARDVVKKRLRYHMRRAIEEGVVVGIHEIPVLEQEVRAEGQPLPALLVKERVNPNPSADTVGHIAGERRDAHTPGGEREFRFEYTASVDILLLTDNPDERTDLEAFIRGALDADRELFMAAGIEAPQVSAFTTHDVDEASGTDLYGSEISVTGGVATRITETLVQVRPAYVTR